MKRFKWTKKRNQAAEELALGHTEKHTAEVVGVHRRTIAMWKSKPEFREEVDKLSLMVGIACKAERVRIAQRAIRQFVTDAGVKTHADVLTWLRFVQSETDGITLDLTSLLTEALAVAGGGQAGDGATSSDEGGSETTKA